ncbi:Cro/C1-type helix-turn-helix domain [Candidatus Nanopelagicaceae bacterium]
MSLGSVIRQARIDAGLSVDDLSERTSIRAGLLKEIESDDFTKCGGETYARGHLRNIAPHIKMDSQLLLELFENEQSMQPRRIQEMLAENNVMTNPVDKKTVSWKTLAGISLSTLALLAAVQIIISNSKTTTVTNPEVVASETATAQPSATAEAQPTQTSAATPTVTRDTYSSGTGVSVSVTAVRGNSWLFVSDSNGTTLYSGQVRNGQKLNFSATTRISLKAGNAGAVDVSVNGKAAQQIGVEGQVVSLTYGVTS